MIPVKIAIIIIIIVLFVVWINRKFNGETGTWDSKKDIEEFATIMKADELDISSIDDIEPVVLENKISFVGTVKPKSQHHRKYITSADIPVTSALKYKPSPSSSSPYNGIKSSHNNKATESIGEKICRTHMEQRFGKPFIKSRPDFLKNPITNNNLELDCFSDELKLAVEYNGKQHYEFVPRFHKNKEEFYGQKYRDDIKRRLCLENGIDLIEVPFSISHESIPMYLDTLLEKLGKIKMT